ncbi:hypothetical protein K3217_20065 [bacterium BD-1]|uniref:hypothetical protein n=1 Tax=Arenimonas sp. TaxID=1872635 RepID=UPI001E41A55C|nr:hypothetical protein [Ottowia caeni]
MLPLAALVAGYAWFVRSPADAPAHAEEPALPGLTGLPVEPSAKPTRTVPRFDPNGVPRPVEPLPPLAELAARADGGDARAACQLAAEMTECDEARLTSRGTVHPRCQALRDEYGGRHFRYLRQAAFAGEPEAMLRYGKGEGFGGVTGESYAFLTSPDFDTWRREAPAMLQAVFEAGYPEAALHLMLAQEPMFGGHLAALLPPDPLRERARMELLVLFAGRHSEAAKIAASLPRVDPALQQEAQALARRWHLEYFRGLEIDPETERTNHAMPLMRDSGQACSQPIPELRK